MERVSREGLEAIVVAIPNSGRHRADEYSPFRDDRVGGGRGDDYLSFLIDTLKPRIDAEFRTRRERAATGIMGSSMGGLISLYALLRRPDTFGFAGAMSPSLWFARGAIFGVASAVAQWDGRLYLDTGTLEGRGHVRQIREMVRLLRRRAVHPRRQIQIRRGTRRPAQRSGVGATLRAGAAMAAAEENGDELVAGCRAEARPTYAGPQDEGPDDALVRRLAGSTSST